MSSLLDRIREPAYTGSRRCWPCTVLNSSLLSVGVLFVGVVVSWLAATVLAVVGALVIWLRGYLIPYTPAFAPRLATALLGDSFQVDEGRSVSEDPTDESEVDSQ